MNVILHTGSNVLPTSYTPLWFVCLLEWSPAPDVLFAWPVNQENIKSATTHHLKSHLHTPTRRVRDLHSSHNFSVTFI